MVQDLGKLPLDKNKMAHNEATLDTSETEAPKKFVSDKQRKVDEIRELVAGRSITEADCIRFLNDPYV